MIQMSFTTKNADSGKKTLQDVSDNLKTVAKYIATAIKYQAANGKEDNSNFSSNTTSSDII